MGWRLFRAFVVNLVWQGDHNLLNMGLCQAAVQKEIITGWVPILLGCITTSDDGNYSV